MLKAVAEELVKRGYLVASKEEHGVKPQLIQDASDANQELIEFMAELECPTAVYRPGEEEPEIGLVHRKPEDGKDIKYFLHTSHDFWPLISSEPELYQRLKEKYVQVEKILELRHELTIFLIDLMTQIEFAMKIEFPILEDSLRRSFVRSCTESLPYNTTVLRGLLYKAEECHKGATIHPDRSFITPHCGDFGGKLLAHLSLEEDGKNLCISPAAGEIAVLFGAKAEIASEGKLRALWHSATTRPDEDRKAMVMFGHVVTPFEVTDAKEDLKNFLLSKGITDQNEHYEAFFNR